MKMTKFNCPKKLAGLIINYTKDLMRNENMPPQKLRRFNRVYMNCYMTDYNIFYKILVYANCNYVAIFPCYNKYNYVWYRQVGIISEYQDSDAVCPRCGQPDHDTAKTFTWTKCHTGSGYIKSDRRFTKLNDKCYKFLNSIKNKIPIIKLPESIKIGQNKTITYLLLRSLKYKEKNKPMKLSNASDMFIFKRISWLPLDLVKYIINLL